jgi:hypothetical protein
VGHYRAQIAAHGESGAEQLSAAARPGRGDSGRWGSMTPLESRDSAESPISREFRSGLGLAPPEPCNEGSVGARTGRPKPGPSRPVRVGCPGAGRARRPLAVTDLPRAAPSAGDGRGATDGGPLADQDRSRGTVEDLFTPTASVYPSGPYRSGPRDSTDTSTTDLLSRGTARVGLSSRGFALLVWGCHHLLSRCSCGCVAAVCTAEHATA